MNFNGIFFFFFIPAKTCSHGTGVFSTTSFQFPNAPATGRRPLSSTFYERDNEDVINIGFISASLRELSSPKFIPVSIAALRVAKGRSKRKRRKSHSVQRRAIDRGDEARSAICTRDRPLRRISRRTDGGTHAFGRVLHIVAHCVRGSIPGLDI